MYKMIILTTPEIAMGFRLVGVDVEEVKDASDAESKLIKIITGSDYGLVAINEEFMEKFSSRTKRLIDEIDVPVVIAFPGELLNRWTRQDRRDYVASLVRGAIGYHIKLTRD